MAKKRILVLMKRFGSNKDMVKENFGREIRLFENIAKKYEIDFVCADFHKKETFSIRKNGINFYVATANFVNPFPLLKFINKIIKNKKYDVVIPTTEPVLGIIGYFFSRKYGIPIIYEVQDNYEIYDSYKIPFIKMLDYHVIRNSEKVFFSNYALKEKLIHLRKDYCEVMENGVDLKTFRLIPKSKARKMLKIGQKIKLITYTGHISKDRGIDNLIEAVSQLRKNDKSIFLFLSGKAEHDIDIKREFIIYMELPKREELVKALNASDVLIIASSDNAFTRYAFPLKLFEYMAVNVPIVATAVGDVKRVLKNFKNSLCIPNSIEDLKNKIMLQLKSKKVNYRNVAMNYTWERLARKLDKIITETTK